MTKLKSIILLGGTALLLGACAGDPSINREAAVELAPMSKPAQPIVEMHLANKGEPYVSTLKSSDDGMVTYTITAGYQQGCTYTSDGWFGPTAEWKDCRSGSGTQEFTKTGDIWPLEIGKTETYEVKGRDEKGNQWQFARRCEVEDAVLVSLQERQVPTYEVICRDKYNTWTYYASPEVETWVKYKRYSNSRGLLDDVELVLQ